MPSNYDKNRIIKNSLLLYVRMLFTMWLNLWTTRLVLANLGVEDYGIYGVVGSVVTMFSVLTGGLATATNRFFCYEMGSDEGNVRMVFCNCINITVAVAAFTFILLEIVGIWFLTHKLQIPTDRAEDAQLVFHISVASCIVTILSIPYNALIVAKEKLGTFAAFSVGRVLLNFTSACVLIGINEHRLIWYSIFLMIASVIFFVSNQIYCRAKFSEAHYEWKFSLSALSSIGKFMGASMLDSVFMVLYSQGIVFIINIAYGVVVNAAYTVSMQVRNSVYSFSQNVQKAIEPQIIKSYATRDYYHFNILVTKGALLEAILLISILIPLQCRTEQIMSLWLGKVPEHLCSFVKVMVFMSLISALTCPVISGAFATGRIKRLLFVSDSFFFAGFGIYYMSSEKGASPELFVILLLIFEAVVGAYRIFLLSQISCFSAKAFVKEVLFPCAITGLTSYCLMCFVNSYIPDTVIGLIGFLSVSTVVLFTLAFFFCFHRSERQQIKDKIMNLLNRHLQR